MSLFVLLFYFLTHVGRKRRFRFLSRRYRNRRVGEFLKELEMTEGRGTGIPKMLREIKKNASPDPIFHTDDDRTFFLVEFPVHPVFAEALKTTPEVGTKLALSRHQLEILRKCNEDTSLLDLEICHLKQSNHSKAFYSLLTRCQPDWRERKETLDKFRLS